MMGGIQRNGRVFLTDGVVRRTLAALRNLASHDVYTTCGEETALNLTFLSRYCRHHMKYRSPRKNPQAFVNDLLEFLDRQPHEVLLPMEQDTLDLVLQHRHEFEKLTILPWPDNARYNVFRDKAKTVELAEKIGVPCPRTAVPHGPNDLLEKVKGFKYPLVIKPRANWAARGLQFVENENELNTVYPQVHAQYPNPLVQEMIPPGEQYHVCCLTGENARPIAFCAQYELRHYPQKLGMGVSTVQQSVHRPDLVELSRQLLAANNWYGVANTDFMIDPRDGTPILMEVNPRFWGPLQSSIHCGVEFPYLLYRLARGEKVEPVLNYELGVMNRSFLPYDILQFLTNPDRWRMEPSFFDFFGSQTHFDIISWNDPLPVAGVGLTVFRYLFDPEVWTRLAHMEKAGEMIAKLTKKEIQKPANPFELQDN